jgi:hypothetical protein
LPARPADEKWLDAGSFQHRQQWDEQRIAAAIAR